MSLLSEKERSLVFEYCLGLASKDRGARARTLISSNAAAAELFSKVKATLAPLDALGRERCPEKLAEETISRICGASCESTGR